jgi:hypothetical protein
MAADSTAEPGAEPGLDVTPAEDLGPPIGFRPRPVPPARPLRPAKQAKQARRTRQ